MFVCFKKNTHQRERERKRENATAAWIRTDGTGGAASQQREGKNLHATKKHKHSQHLPNLIKMQLRTGVIS